MLALDRVCKQIRLRLFTLVGVPNCVPYSLRNKISPILHVCRPYLFHGTTQSYFKDPLCHRFVNQASGKHLKGKIRIFKQCTRKAKKVHWVRLSCNSSPEFCIFWIIEVKFRPMSGTFHIWIKHRGNNIVIKRKDWYCNAILLNYPNVSGSSLDKFRVITFIRWQIFNSRKISLHSKSRRSFSGFSLAPPIV